MEAITFGLILSFIAIGLITGLLVGALIKTEGVSIKWNIIFGILFAIILGIYGVLMGYDKGFFFAFVGTLAALYLVNAFHLHHQEDLGLELFDDSHIEEEGG